MHHKFAALCIPLGCTAWSSVSKYFLWRSPIPFLSMPRSVVCVGFEDGKIMIKQNTFQWSRPKRMIGCNFERVRFSASSAAKTSPIFVPNAVMLEVSQGVWARRIQKKTLQRCAISINTPEHIEGCTSTSCYCCVYPRWTWGWHRALLTMGRTVLCPRATCLPSLNECAATSWCFSVWLNFVEVRFYLRSPQTLSGREPRTISRVK